MKKMAWFETVQLTCSVLGPERSRAFRLMCSLLSCPIGAFGDGKTIKLSLACYPLALVWEDLAAL